MLRLLFSKVSAANTNKDVKLALTNHLGKDSKLKTQTMKQKNLFFAWEMDEHRGTVSMTS